MISFACPHCSHGIQVDEALAGRRGKCIKCGSRIDVPPAVEKRAEHVMPAPSTMQKNLVGCADCAALISPKAITCPQCGAPTGAAKPVPEEAPSPYRYLRGCAIACSVIGWLLIGSSVLATFGIWMEPRGADYRGPTWLDAGMVLGGIAAGVPYLALGQAIRAFLAIEQNTRATRNSLRRLEARGGG